MSIETKSREDTPTGFNQRVTDALRALVRSDEIGVLVAFLGLCFILAVTTDTFFLPLNLLEVTRQASYIGIMVVGMVFVLSMGDVDLSTGSIYMLVGIVTALAMRAGYNVWLSVVLGIGVGGLCGLVNGGLSVLLQIPTIIVTLGTLTIYRAFGLVLTQARPVSGFPKDNLLIEVGGGKIGIFPTSTIVMLVLTFLGYLLYNRTPFGHRVRAIGGNLQAARFSGIQITKHRLLVMMLQGMLCAVSGIMAVAFLGSADVSAGTGFELLVIAAAIIGGTALSGGSGTVIGGLLGALIIAVIRNGLILWGVNIYWTGAATGGVIIAAVTIDYFIKRRRGRG